MPKKAKSVAIEEHFHRVALKSAELTKLKSA